jgi:hypothetical protein
VKNSAENLAVKIVTGKVRLDNVHVFRPILIWGIPSPAKYRVTMLIPKSDTKTLAEIKQAIVNAGGNSFEIKSLLKDGDQYVDGISKPEYEGHYLITATSLRKPEIVDAGMRKIADSTEIYSGCYARVSIIFFDIGKIPDYMGLSCVGCGLGNIQKLMAGKRINSLSRIKTIICDLFIPNGCAV